MESIRRVLILPHVKVHNANALSSPFTIGFPAMTAWLGFTHALQRKMNNTQGFKKVEFQSVAIICHNMNLQTSKEIGSNVYSIVGTGNPLDKSGQRPPFIAEPRCHLEVSLVIEYTGISQDEVDVFRQQVDHHLYASLKIAGGDILTFKGSSVDKIEEGNDAELKKFIRRLMPGYVLIERRDLMEEAMRQGQDALGALLDYLVIHNSCTQDEEGYITWSGKRKTSGWIVPIATGFQGLTELGKAKNQRDPEVPHRFAESVVTLGEFLMPYRISSLDEMLWHYHTDLENDLYLCRQKKAFIQPLTNK